MIEELKYDNKLLKDQMLSEIKNEKQFSSFEHQIKELRRENSRLNHMMYDVAKVLENQKETRDRYHKKEADYSEHFKKEINKLKEHINILKFDNEELQKQLVRVRYASYSQDVNGEEKGKHHDERGKEQKEETKYDDTGSAEEIPLDINSLKKWNELISLLSKELSLSLGKDDIKIKSHSEKRNIIWHWKAILQDFKGTFDEFRLNITSKFSDYKKKQENAVSDIYKSLKKFFSPEEQNVPSGEESSQWKTTPPGDDSSQHKTGDDSSQWKNIGDFFRDLKDKWANIKNRIDTSDLKKFFKDFKMSRESAPQYTNQEAHEYNERKPANDHFETTGRPSNNHYGSERKPANTRFESERKHGKVQAESEDSEWLFDRAASRAELRESEKEEGPVNWFLKKKKQFAKDNPKETKY